MKKSRKTSLLVSASAVAGLAMGASIAMAATLPPHPPITLYTYEEIAAQYNGPAATQTNPFPSPSQPMPVMVGGNPQNAMQGMPYSPKQTCTGGGLQSGKCHSDNTTDTYSSGTTKVLKGFSKIADHAFHSQMGENEWMDNTDSGKFVTAATGGMQTGLNPQKPWLQSHGHNGKW